MPNSDNNNNHDDDVMVSKQPYPSGRYTIRKTWLVLLIPVWYLCTLLLTVYIVPPATETNQAAMPIHSSATETERRLKNKHHVFEFFLDSVPSNVYYRSNDQHRIETEDVPPLHHMIHLPSMRPSELEWIEAERNIGELKTLSVAVAKNVTKLHHRASHVKWGGTVPWWMSTSSHGERRTINGIDGGHLLWHYSKITQYDRKDHEWIRFPTKKCRHGCPLHEPIAHTLKWREAYQPWKHTPNMIVENTNGWVYSRGFSKRNQHSMVWLRLGRHTVMDEPSYYRCILHAADQAIADALKQSEYQTGKFNVLIDGSHFAWTNVPDMKYTRQAILMLQDHYPSRLGVVLLTNLSRLAELAVSLVQPLLSKDVRGKILILSHDADRRLRELETFVDRQFIPDWLGGNDTYQFDVSHVYHKRFRMPNAQALEFETKLPYHALSS